MTDQEKSDLVAKLINLRYRYGSMSCTTDKPPINYFIHPPLGSFGRPRPSDRQLRRQAAAERAKKGIDRPMNSHAAESKTGDLVTNATRPWDRRPDETAKQYRAFTFYRDLGADRTIAETEREGLGYRSVLQTWSRVFQWAQRVRAYDEYEEKRLRKVAERQRKEMVERQARLGETMTGIAQRSLDGGMIVPETVADVVRLAESGTRIERLARGESTENRAMSMSLVLAHPLPPWAPEEVKQLVVENEFEEQDGQGNVVVNRDTAGTGSKTEA